MGTSLQPLSGLERLRALDAARPPVKKKTGLQRLQEIDQDSQVENRSENIWDALGVGDEVKRTGQGQVSVQTGMPDKGEKEYARQFVTGRDASGKPFDMIGENIKLQQNPELADRVARHIAEIKAENSRQPGFVQRHVEDWEHAQNPNIIGGQRTDVTGYDPQGFPMREPVQQFAQKNPIVQPDEPNAQTLQEYQHGAATALSDIANIGFAGDMAGSLAAEKVAAPLAKSFAKRVLKSGAQGAAINAPLSAADQALNNPNHLQGALEGAATGAIGGFALGAGGHAALEGIAGGLNKLRALDQVVRTTNPVALQTAGGAAAGAVGGAYTADEGHKLEGAEKGALLGGAAGYAHGKYEGRIPGLSTEQVEAAARRVDMAKDAALEFYDKTRVHPISMFRGKQGLEGLHPQLRQRAEAIETEWNNAMSAFNNARKEEFRGQQPLRIVNEGPRQIETKAAPVEKPRPATDIEHRQYDTEAPKDLTLGEPPVVRHRPYASELSKALEDFPTAPGAPVARRLLEQAGGDKEAVRAGLGKLSVNERDMLTALTGKDYHNLEREIPAKPANFGANYLFTMARQNYNHPGAGIAKTVAVALKKDPSKTFQDVVSSVIKPEDRQALADFLDTKAYSASSKPVLAMWANPVGPALKNIYGKPLTGAVVGGTVGGLEDKENRTRGVLAGAGIGAVAGSLGAKGGARAALRDLYQMPEVKLAADFERTFHGLKTGYRKAFVTPFAGMEKSYPELATRLNADAGAFKNAEHIGRRQTEWVTEGLSDPQKEQFGKKLVLDNLEAEETRKLQAANDTQQHVHTLRQGAAALTTQANTEYQYAESLRRQGLHVQAKAAERVAATLEKEASANIHQAVDLEAQATELRDAAGHFKEHADKLRPEVQPKVEDEPWFKDALAKHNKFVAPDLQEAAINAGVAPGSLRQPSSAYVRLFSEERLRNRQIRRAQDLAIQKPEAAKARNRVFKTLIGEKPDRARVLPPGATDPMEGPRNPLVESTTTDSSRPVEGASRSGSSKMARGTAERYVTDYKTLVHEDARDKITRGTRNAVYDELANGAGRLLQKGEEPREGKEAVQRYIKLPSGDLEAQRFEVTPEVKNVFDRWEHEGKVRDYEGSRFRRLAGVFTKAQISGMPVEATSHANTLASIVASVPGEKDAAGKALTALPLIGAKAAAIREMNSIDFTSEATRSLEKRLARAGALRIEEPSGGDKFAFFHGKDRTSLVGNPSRINEFADERRGLLSSAHHWLFGPEGIDVRGRLVLARKYLDRKPNATDKELFEFITGKLGNYNRASSGRAINALQDSQFSAFGRFQGARIPTAVKSLFGQSGLPANSIGQKLGDVANTLYRGPVGYGIGAQIANRAMTGHFTNENEPGHHFDVQLGNPFTQHAAEAGPDDRPVYLPFATANPVAATGMRATGAMAAMDPKGWKRSPLEMITGPINTALGVASPFVRGMWSTMSGTAPYMEPNGSFLQTAATRFSPGNTLGERLHEGVVHMNPALAAFAGSGGDPGGRTLAGALSDGTRFGGGPGAMAARAAEFLLPRIVNPGVGGRDNPSSRDFVESATYREALRQWTNQARRQPNIDSFETVSDEALRDMKDAGYDDEAIDKVLQTLEKAWQNRDKTREDAARRAEQLNDRLRER